MAFSRGVVGKPVDSWHVGDQSEAWLKAHEVKPPWRTPPVTLTAYFEDGTDVKLDLEYRGLNDQGIHQLHVVWPPEKGPCRFIHFKEIRNNNHRVQVHISRRRRR